MRIHIYIKSKDLKHLQDALLSRNPKLIPNYELNDISKNIDLQENSEGKIEIFEKVEVSIDVDEYYWLIDNI